ncbi:hypothetical protein V8E54_013413 [Elaphomyces granulatus]
MLLYPETSYYNRKRNEGRSLPDGTEASFISFWDVNIRWILEYLIPEGKSIRDSNNLCVFRGEEKPPGSRADPKQELSDKLEWAEGFYALRDLVPTRVTLNRCEKRPEFRTRIEIKWAPRFLSLIHRLAQHERSNGLPVTDATRIISDFQAKHMSPLTPPPEKTLKLRSKPMQTGLPRKAIRAYLSLATSQFNSIPSQMTQVFWLADSGKHNVLYSRDSKAVTLIDFDSIGQCTGEEVDELDAPEILAIFGREQNNEP